MPDPAPIVLPHSRSARTRPPPRRRVVVLPRIWTEDALSRDLAIGVEARGQAPRRNTIEMMMSDDEIAEALSAADYDRTELTAENTGPGDLFRSVRESAERAIRRLSEADTAMPPPRRTPPRMGGDAPLPPVTVAAGLSAGGDLVATAHQVAGEIRRRLAEADFWAPHAVAADMEETQQFLIGAEVLACCEPGDAQNAKLQVNVYGVPVMSLPRTSFPAAGRDYHGGAVDGSWQGADAETIVNLLEEVLAPSAYPSVLDRITAESPLLRNAGIDV